MPEFSEASREQLRGDPVCRLVRMRSFVATALAVWALAACGGDGGDGSDTSDDRPQTPKGTEEAQESFESFLGNPIITETQAEETRAMVWRACTAFDDGSTWHEFEDQTKADAEAEGRALGTLQVTGMRIAAGKGIAAYCPEHSDKAP